MFEDWKEIDRRHSWHPYTPNPVLGPEPRLFVRAEGAYVFDESGKAFLDATSSWWCQIHGHCHPRLVQALKIQAETLDQILFSPHAHPVALKLTQKLLERMGEPFRRVFFSDDGSTAVEAGIKMAIQYWKNEGFPKKRKLLSLSRAYHGDTLGAMAVGDVGPFKEAFSGSVPDSLKVSVECAEAFEQMIEEHSAELAAFIVEPLVLGAGGMIFYSKEDLERMTAYCKKRNVLVIFDEVFTGFGRTGTFFAYDQIESRPDIVCLSKGLTSGMLPLAATVTTEKVYQAFSGGGEKTFYHGHTFTANALGCAVALESLKIFEEEKTLEKAAALTSVMIDQRERFSEFGEVRSLGVIWALDLAEPLHEKGWQIAARLFEEGIWMRPLHQTLYFIPPYCTKRDELKHAFDVLYSAIRGCT